MKIIRKLLLMISALCVLGMIVLVALYLSIKSSLPDVKTIKDIQLSQPMYIYTSNGKLMAEIGEDKRKLVTYDEIPKKLVDAFLAAEDQRFFSHNGIDFFGILRALKASILHHGWLTQGASTITQQVARNMFLTREKTLSRKLKEAVVAIEIEKNLSKKEIFELYVNKIFLGHRSYGIKVAAQTYFNKELKDLTISEMAILAALPKGPAVYNPIYSVKNATSRRNYVLRRMLESQFITQEEYTQAINEPIISKNYGTKIEFVADYVAEQVRQEMITKYGEDATKKGYHVYTTINSDHQIAANEAVRNNLLNYTNRHGYADPLYILEASKDYTDEELFNALIEEPDADPLMPAVILEGFNKKGISIILKNGEKQSISSKNLSLAGAKSRLLTRGKLVWFVKNSKDEWILSQLPKANTGFISLNSTTGAIDAMVGGYSFNYNKFNRATQALVQVGSAIKPFIYAAAVDKGITLATIVNDEPFTEIVAGKSWSPKNSPNTYSGPISIREALGKSKNIVAIKTLNMVGIDYTAQYLERFGFKKENIDATKSLALGSASFTPLEMARGYATFVNGGYLVKPYLIETILDSHGKEIYHSEPKIACTEKCDDIPVVYGNVEKTIASDSSTIKININTLKEKYNIDVDNTNNNPDNDGVDDETLDGTKQIERVPDLPSLSDLNKESSQKSNDNDLVLEHKNDSPYADKIIDSGVAFLIKSALNSNVYGKNNWQGIAWKAKELKRNDVGGKTGTTNQSKIGWYVGHTGNLVSSLFVGFDDNKLNIGEAGAKIAQPVWINYMKAILKDIPVAKLDNIPKNIITKSINPAVGLLGKGSSEYFIKGTEPTKYYVEEHGYDDGSNSGKEIF